MFLNATWKENKLNLLNSTWKWWKFTVDPPSVHYWSTPKGSTVLIISEVITSEAIINPLRINSVDHLRGNYQSPSPGSAVLIASEVIASETINTVDLVGNNYCLWGNQQSTQIGWRQNSIVGIARCIMGNPFSTNSYFQVHSVFTSFVKFGKYWQKSKGDRLVYTFLVKMIHYYECQMFLIATWKDNKLNLLNSTWKVVKFYCWSSLCWLLIYPPGSRINSVNHLRGDHLRGNCQSPQNQQCWSPQRQSPQRWLLISSWSTVSIASKVIASEVIVDQPPPHRFLAL